LPLDHRSWHEDLAGVARVLVDDACRDSFTALEARARIEIVALATCVKIAPAVGASTLEGDVGRRLGATR